jgi:hypothetical protein
MLFIHYVRESLQKGMLVGAFEELSDMEWKLLAGLSPPDPMKGDRVMLYAPLRKVFNTCSRPRARAVAGGPPIWLLIPRRMNVTSAFPGARMAPTGDS